MKITLQIAILLALILAVAVRASRQEPHPHRGIVAAEPAWVELDGHMAKMHAAMSSVAPSGDSDVDFVRMMLPHHQAAIDMAETQLLYGKDPQMRRLAQEIIADQQSEIELMQLWLQQHQTGSAQDRSIAAICSAEER